MATERLMKAVLFDLDGTLVFHDQARFLKEYFKSISAFVAKSGFDPKLFVEAVSYASGVVIANDGVQVNKAVFWGKFFEYIGRYDESIIEISDQYYVTEFKKLRQFTTPNNFAKAAVELAHKNEKKVVLATNPLFPMTAQVERLSWSGLSAEDFDLITAYENSNYCKPNPQYYLEICKKINIPAANVVMIGNDEREDMKAASEIGMMGYLVTDCRIIANDYYWKGQRGTFEQSLHMLNII